MHDTTHELPRLLGRLTTVLRAHAQSDLELLRRFTADRDEDAGAAGVRASAAAGPAEPVVVCMPVADASVERSLGRSSHHADGADGTAGGIPGQDSVSRMLGVLRREQAEPRDGFEPVVIKDGEFVGAADATMLRYQTGMLLHILK